MAPAPQSDASKPQETKEAASGRHVGVHSTTFGNAALRLFDNGYLPIPIVPDEKRPALPRWSKVPIDQAAVENWARQFPGHGIGLRTGALVGIDIDVLDPELAHQIDQVVRSRLGDTLTRVGQWPKRLLLYRTETPFAKMRSAGIEILGRGQQFVAFGTHPDTGQPYHWPLGDTPLNVPFEQLPLVDAAICEALLGEVAALMPGAEAGWPQARARRSPRVSLALAGKPERDRDGRVVDGRDGWLSTIAYHAVQDAIAAVEGSLGVADLAAIVWNRFAATADLERPAPRGKPYSIADAERKVADKLRLLADGRLPPRAVSAIEANYEAPILAAFESRGRLKALIADACTRIEAWAPPRPKGRRPASASRPRSGSARAPSPAISCWRCVNA